MREIYGDTIAVIRANLGYFLGLAGLAVTLDWLDAHEVVGLIIGIVVMYQVYRHLLFGRPLSLASPFRGATLASLAKFTVVLALMVIVPVALILAIVFAVMSPETVTNDFETSANVFLGLFLLFYGGLLILFGTAVPATAAGEGILVSLSLDRSRKTALDIAAGLLAGPAIMAAAYFAGTYYATGSISDDIDLSRLRPLVAQEVVLATALEVGSSLQTILLAVVLCRAYAKVRPRPEAERLVQIFS